MDLQCIAYHSDKIFVKKIQALETDWVDIICGEDDGADYSRALQLYTQHAPELVKEYQQLSEDPILSIIGLLSLHNYEYVPNDNKTYVTFDSVDELLKYNRVQLLSEGAAKMHIEKFLKHLGADSVVFMSKTKYMTFIRKEHPFYQ